MKALDFEFNGKTYALSFTAEALFKTYEKFGVCESILDATQAFEPTEQGWVNCCWLLALMASQGELQRRHLGYDAQEMLSLEDLRTGCLAGDVPRVRKAVRDCLEMSFTREEIPDAQQEVNLVLQAREEAAKKAMLLARSALDTLRQQLSSFLSRSGKRSS